MRIFSMKNQFNMGIKAFRIEDYKTAQMFFTSTLNSESFKEASQKMLIRIYISVGNYLEARRKIFEFFEGNNLLRNEMLALLEEIEYNYNRSLELYSKCLESSYKLDELKLKEARVFFENGDKILAKNILHNLNPEKALENEKKIYEISFYIATGDYITALKKLKEIKYESLPERLKHRYNHAKIIIYALIDYDLNLADLQGYEHFKKAVLCPDDSYIIEYLKKVEHKKALTNPATFNDRTDYESLIAASRELMQTVNPMFNKTEAIYKVLFDKPIGFSKDTKMCGLSIVTAIGTDKITGITPFIPSEEFDRENKRTSFVLERKLNYK